MSYPNKKTGRGGSATVNGNVITITGWTSKHRRELADGTDSADFDPTTGQLWTSQEPGAIGLDVTIEGNFNLDSTSSNIVQLLKSDPPADIALYLTPTAKYGEGKFDLSDCETKVQVPGGTMITFTANAKSNGPFAFS